MESKILVNASPATSSEDTHAVPRDGIPVKIIAASVAGNALEFYDFVSYAFFAVYIGKTFFPAADPATSLLLSVAVFGVGFFARPLGGILIGAFADRAGRKPAMLLTIALITIGTLGLALTPSYASIGIAAPVIVVFCRLIQGLALGGEVGPSSAFLIESAPAAKRGLFGSWQLASQGAATLVAGLIGLYLSRTLSPAEMLAWGWRVPFFFGLALIPIALYLRRAMPETLHQGTTKTKPASPTRLADHRSTVTMAVFVVLGGTVSTYMGNFMTTYAITTLKFSPSIAMTATVVVGVVTLVSSLLGGWMSDRLGRKPVMLWPRIAAALLTVPAFNLLIASPSPAMLFAVTGFLAALTGISGAASLVAIPELFPRALRATGMSIAYAVGVSLFGGTTQFVIVWLMSSTGNPSSPAWYVAATSIVTAIAMLAMPESRNRPLKD